MKKLTLSTRKHGTCLSLKMPANNNRENDGVVCQIHEKINICTKKKGMIEYSIDKEKGPRDCNL